MNFSHFVRPLGQLAFACLLIVGQAGSAAERKPTRPYFCIFAASIDRMMESCEEVFDSVGRHDLALTLSDRLKSVRNFDGIDRSRPLGMMSIWGDQQSTDVIFLPLKDADQIDDLLKTVTFGIVGYRKISATHYQIDRPGSPYEAVIRDGYVFLGDSLPTIQQLRVTPEQLTRGLRDRYETAIVVDPAQIPVAVRTKYIKEIRGQAEPVLQPQDDEQPETARVRRAIGNLLLSLIERTILDTSSAVVGAHLDPETRKLSIELSIHAERNSPMAATFDQWNRRRSHFTSLLDSDVYAGIAINVPVGGLFDEILGTTKVDAGKNVGRLDAGLQIVGNQTGRMTLIAALRGEETLSLNRAIPDLLLQFHKAQQIRDVVEDFETVDGITLHSFRFQHEPEWLTVITGPAPEVIVGQGQKTTWVGIGQSANLLDDLEDAIDRVGDGSTDKANTPLAQARFQATQLPDMVKSDLLIPNADAEMARQAFAKGDDGLTLTIDPITSGIRIRVEAEQGFVRLIGRDWVKQIESRAKE